MVLGVASPSWAETRNVPGDYPTIQEAIEAARDGDEVLVAPGTYVENIDFLGKAITVRSAGGPAVTVIDGSALTLGPGQGSVVTFETNEGPDSVIEGFTLTKGTGNSGPFFRAGGGICSISSSPTFRDNTIVANPATTFHIDTYSSSRFYSVSNHCIVAGSDVKSNTKAICGREKREYSTINENFI